MRLSVVINQQNKKRKKPNLVDPVYPLNQIEEIQYFDSYLLPLSEKNNLQSALDEYGSIRLEKGDYRGTSISISSNQKIYGHPSLQSIVPNITIKAGSTGIILDHLFCNDNSIILEAGAEINNCKLKSIKWGVLIANNSRFSNNEFINFGGIIRWDCSTSGYFRNNKIIKHQTGTASNLLVMRGNSSTPSYGNVHVHTNFLTPWGDTTDMSNIQTSTFVGIDAEGWNLKGEGIKPMFKASNFGNLKITDFGGANDYSEVITGAYEIDAINTFILNKEIKTNLDKISANNNISLFNGLGTYGRLSGTVTGFELLGNNNDSKTITYNGVEQTVPITNPATISQIKNSILTPQYTPWNKPNWETLPDPLGINWQIDRIGKPDSRAYIQNLIDTNKIAELPEGIFYISSTLFLPLDREHGIIGKGTAKTVICALTDTFPLISLTGGQDDNFTLANITLQGGTKGIYSSQDYGNQHMSFLWLKYVIFRNQTNGIHLKQMIGFDNNFLDHVDFVNCGIGFYQEALQGGDSDHSSFVDKTAFYECQFINCNNPISMIATRADNLNAWINCNFNTGDVAFKLNHNNFPMIVNSNLSNYTGENVIQSEKISLYNCDISNNNVTKSTIKAISINLEGCNCTDDINLMGSVIFNSVNAFIVNSKIKGNVSTLPIDLDWNSEFNACFVNSTLESNTALSKFISYIKQNNPRVVIDEFSNPYPQLLVTQ